MQYDPYSNNQLRALRRDPTGRHNPIPEEFDKDARCLGVIGGALFGCVLALLFWLAI